MNQLRFVDLKHNDVFLFLEPEAPRLQWNGPWVKGEGNFYRHIDEQNFLEVSSPDVPVKQPVIIGKTYVLAADIEYNICHHIRYGTSPLFENCKILTREDNEPIIVRIGNGQKFEINVRVLR